MQKGDEGRYISSKDLMNGLKAEKLVSTGSGIMSHFVNLEIVVPEAFIVGAADYHVVLGGTINLVCVIEKSPTPPQYVLWYHNSKMINYDTTRGGVQVRTEQGQKTESHLTIHEAKDSDSGNYTCSASNTQPAYIHVFVSDVGEFGVICDELIKG
nr:roundabout homolog 1-like [Halyomorpha halys]